MNALSLGVRRGVIEQGTLLRDRKELATTLIGGVGMFVLLTQLIGGNPAGGGVGMKTFMAVGFMAFTVFSTGVMALPMLIAADREEGALLRLRALPKGVRVYVIGRTVAILLPVSMLPEPMGWAAQAFPLYWLGHGLRAAFLPHAAGAAEIGGAWELGHAALVMGAWAIAGIVLAPWLLRKVTGK